MCGADLIVAMAPITQQVPRVGMEGGRFDERQRGRIEPLQVIDENDERCSALANTPTNRWKMGLKP